LSQSLVICHFKRLKLRRLGYKHRGFTFIEMVISLVIMAIISIVIGNIMLQGYQNFLTANNINEADWNGFVALERIVEDIHNIRSAAAITTIQPSDFSFTDMNGNNVQYQISGSSLLRNSQTLASGIQSFSFSYLDKNGSTTSTAANVRYITTTILLTQGISFATTAATRGML